MIKYLFNFWFSNKMLLTSFRCRECVDTLLGIKIRWTLLDFAFKFEILSLRLTYKYIKNYLYNECQKFYIHILCIFLAYKSVLLLGKSLSVEFPPVSFGCSFGQAMRRASRFYRHLRLGLTAWQYTSLGAYGSMASQIRLYEFRTVARCLGPTLYTT